MYELTHSPEALYRDSRHELNEGGGGFGCLGCSDLVGEH